jgi:hypothetical protein
MRPEPSASEQQALQLVRARQASAQAKEQLLKSAEQRASVPKQEQPPR